LQKRILITLFFCFSSIAAAAQIDDSKANEGSVYSKFGVGLPVDYGSSSADGMGLWGVSDTESLVPGTANPAHWGYALYGKASGGLEIQNYSSEDNFGSATNSLVSLNDFQLQLPVYRGKLGVSASFSPYSRKAFETTDSGQQVIGSGSAADTLNFGTVNVGEGGINKIELGLGWKINNNIAVGYAASLLFASIDNGFTTQFASGAYQPVNTTLQTSASGFGNRFGAYLTLPSLTREDDQLNVGLAVELPVTLDGEKVQEAAFVSGDPDDPDSAIETTLASGDIKTPLGLTAGVTYQFGEQLALTTEGRYEQWSDYENELDQTVESVVFSDRMKIGGGIKYYPYFSGSDKFLSQFKYRLGASYDSGHLNINGEDVETLMLSAGLGIISPVSPALRGSFRSSVDLSFYYGIRGTTNQNLVKENIWGIKLSLNLAELFFFRPKLQ
jgi:hypothetical protein